ncbi:MAG: Cysteine-tRNA ligase [Candidatus Saccharibacteria bacterium GW2011_GWC2_48_9]|nr:MAG: Cysteine-tRNA ligase [Candidatus Saccharibacteria bacterium GW2011_GWC2_48_9]HCH34454.1 cysteine--tRNA ligase [Candidatus Saccharibacteria bacterium]
MSSLQFYNTRTRTTEKFIPQHEGAVKLYTCGPTVYDHLTVGNWTAYIYWDVLVRLLEANNYTVHRVMNITDVGHLVSDADDGEDKLEKGARREGKTAWDVAKFYGDDFLRGMERLNLKKPEYITKATDYIPQQLELVHTLQQRGYTYQIDDGIYFDTSKFSTYADFAHLDVDAQKAGARVEFNQEKRNASDFALWKFTPPGETRDMEWHTPENLLTEPKESRKGFPGWHLECSAMAMDLLGHTLDIHTGGIDHIPVHHTNEIAQSEAATGERFSNYWLHNNHLKVDGTKISKSLGNGYTLDDLEAKGYSPEALRMFVLQSSYQTEGNFTFENLEAAKRRLHNWRRAAVLRHQIHETLRPAADTMRTPSYAAIGALVETLNDNMNTPEALAHIDKVLGNILVASPATIDRLALIEFIEKIDSVLGFNLMATTADISDSQKQTILERRRARDDKDWKRSDELRDALLADGIQVRDNAEASSWEYVE